MLKSVSYFRFGLIFKHAEVFIKCMEKVREVDFNGSLNNLLFGKSWGGYLS